MIVIGLQNSDHQVPMTPSLRQAFDFLRTRELLQLPEGRLDIDGDLVFALVQRYETIRMDAPTFECHRKYIDVQFIAMGEETICWSSAERMSVTEAYDAGKDVCFGTIPAGTWTPVYLKAGQAAIFWPEDAHAPKGAAGESSRVMKIVVKVAV